MVCRIKPVLVYDDVALIIRMRRISSQMWRQLCGCVASCVEDLASLRRSGKPLLGGEELYRGPECSICVERPTLLRPAGPSLLSSAVLTLWPQSSSSAAYASTGRYRLKRGAVEPPTVSESAPARPHRTSSHHQTRLRLVPGELPLSGLCLACLDWVGIV